MATTREGPRQPGGVLVRQRRPLGIRHRPVHNGVFPKYDDIVREDPEALLGGAAAVDDTPWSDPKVEVDEMAIATLKNYINKGFIKAFKSYAAVKSYLKGVDPVVSDLVVLTKEWEDQEQTHTELKSKRSLGSFAQC